MDSVMLCGYSLPSLSSKPAGAYTMAGIFRNFGLECQVIDFLFLLGPAQRATVFKKYLNEDTKFIAFSTTLAGTPGNQYVYLNELDDQFRPVMEEAKQYAPNAKWIVGGHKVLRENSSLPFDYCVRGIGEECTEAILEHELHGKDLIIQEEIGITKFISDKDYKYDIFNSKPALKFHERDFVEYQETLPLEVSRGCVFNCSYCDYYLNGKKFGDFTKKEDFIYEAMMHNYEKFGTTRYIITDDTLNDSIDKAYIFASLAKRLPFELEFGGSMRLELFYKHKEMAQLFLDSGLRAVNFGIETFNKKAGSQVGKGFGEKAKEVLEDIEKVWKGKVAVSINIILGLPYDTTELLTEQHKWIVNSTAVDSILYHPFYIWRVKDTDSILRSGELFGYYKDTKLSTNPRYIDWVSPLTSFKEVHDLADNFREDFGKTKGSLLNGSHNSFITMMVMKKLSIAQQRQTPLADLDGIFRNMITERVASFQKRLINE